MAKTPISEEEALQVSEEVRETFLRENAESDEFDPRDLQRVRSDLELVAKFARQQRGDHDNALKQMIASLKWRHSLGVNDIHYEDIDEHYWRSGMAYNRGLDKNGNHIVILNIRFHKKDSKKAVALQRWISFCFESHCRVYPKGRMCMIFDMSGCGLSQMDMDLMRFIVNCFKIYFPDMLAVLLVFNMPWILQAAWKIVQSWLSEGAIAKVKFVNSETILEYVSADQLLVKFGGMDEWQFDYETEKAVMLNLVREWMEREERKERERGRESGIMDSLTLYNEFQSSDMEQNPGGGSVEGSALVEGGVEGQREGRGSGDDGGGREQAEGQREGEGSEEGRKVRFSSNLPPTRQSRYGPDDDDGEGERRSMASPDNQQLLRGSAASHGFRRRQVHKLMSLQTDQRGRRSPLDKRDVPFTHIELSPAHELVFTGSRDTELPCVLSLSNSSQEAAAFKIKTTAPRRYKVRPNLALIQPKSVAKVQVVLVPGTSKEAISEDKFLVQIFSFSESVSVPSQNQLLSFWRALSDKDISEHRMRCRWVKEDPPSLLPQSPAPIATSTPHTPSLPSPPPSSHTDTQSHRELRTIGNKLDRLLTANHQLTTAVIRLQRWLILQLALLAILFLTILYR